MCCWLNVACGCVRAPSSARSLHPHLFALAELASEIGAVPFSLLALDILGLAFTSLLGGCARLGHLCGLLPRGLLGSLSCSDGPLRCNLRKESGGCDWQGWFWPVRRACARHCLVHWRRRGFHWRRRGFHWSWRRICRTRFRCDRNLLPATHFEICFRRLASVCLLVNSCNANRCSPRERRQRSRPTNHRANRTVQYGVVRMLRTCVCALRAQLSTKQTLFG